MLGDYCYDVCPIGSFLDGDYCTSCFPSCSQFAHLIAFEEQFSSESKAINFPFDDPIFPIYNEIFPLT